MKEFFCLNNVCFYYDKKSKNFVLNDVSLKINQGDFVAFVGANGSGKSTLSKLLNAIYLPVSGAVLVEGVDTKEEEMTFAIRKKVGLIFQDPDNQIVATVVEEDVAFALENLCFEKKQMEQVVAKSLEDVDMLEFKKDLVENLSGGQKSKVAVAGVIAMNPKCVIFDESTAMLDPKSRREIINIMKKLNEKGTTIINITHNMEEVFFCDRVFVFKDGRLLKEDVPRNIFSDEELIEKAGLCLPQIVELIKRLFKEGLIKQNVALSVEECVEILSGIL